MCRCCQNCFETCYWHLIEERFCFDETIASYQEPITKEEKNNNLFDNMAFYDSVSVIAGRSIVTIDPLPEKKNQIVVEQPKRLTKKSSSKKKLVNEKLPSVLEEISVSSSSGHEDDSSGTHEIKDEESSRRILAVKKTVSFENLLSGEDLKDDSGSKSDTSLPETKNELRKKSLKERRMSKSLSLRIDYPEELPIIRQSSVPKFFLDTPEDNQTESSLIRTPLTALQSPMVQNIDGFHFDLKSVVHIETTKRRQPKDVPAIHRESSVSKLSQIKKNIKLRKSKSTVSASNIPHTNYI